MQDLNANDIAAAYNWLKENSAKKLGPKFNPRIRGNFSPSSDAPKKPVKARIKPKMGKLMCVLRKSWLFFLGNS
jgi:hypothetical protein